MAFTSTVTTTNGSARPHLGVQGPSFNDSGYEGSNDASSIGSNSTRPGAASAQSYRISHGNSSVTTSTTTTTTTTVSGGKFRGTTTIHQSPLANAPQSPSPIRSPSPITRSRTPIAEAPGDFKRLSHHQPIAQPPRPVSPESPAQLRPQFRKRKSVHLDWDPDTLDKLDSAAPPDSPFMTKTPPPAPWAGAAANFSRPSPTHTGPVLRPRPSMDGTQPATRPPPAEPAQPAMKPRPSAEAIRRRSSAGISGKDALRELRRIGRESKPQLSEAARNFANGDITHAQPPPHRIDPARQYQLPNGTEAPPVLPPLPSRSPHRHATASPVSPFPARKSRERMTQIDTVPQRPWAEAHAPPDPMYHGSPPLGLGNSTEVLGGVGTQQSSWETEMAQWEDRKYGAAVGPGGKKKVGVMRKLRKRVGGS